MVMIPGERTENDIRYKKYRRRNIVLIALQFKLLPHPFNSCISDVCAIDMCQQVKNRNNYDQSSIDLLSSTN